MLEESKTRSCLSSSEWIEGSLVMEVIEDAKPRFRGACDVPTGGYVEVNRTQNGVSILVLGITTPMYVRDSTW